jgi:hypothetical protein
MLVLTDLEPDDIFAILLMYLRGFDIDTFFIGKRSLDVILPLYNQMIDCLINDLIISNKPKLITASDELADAIDKSTQIMCLMPSRELIKNKHLLATKTVYFYGGFNFRSIIESESANKKDLLDMLDSCSETYIYESYHATGNNNSINRSKYPEIYKSLGSYDHYSKFLFNAIKDWNQPLLDKSLKSLKELKENESLTDTEKEKFIRVTKIIAAMTDSLDSQMVLADFGLVSVINTLDIKPSKYYIDFLNGNTVLSDQMTDHSAKKQSYVYKDIGIDNIVKRIITILNVIKN